MEFEFKKDEIVFNRELSVLDKLTLRFVKVLEKTGTDYVIILTSFTWARTKTWKMPPTYGAYSRAR